MTTGSHHLDRFVQVASPTECWPFVGARDKDGYGLYRPPRSRMVRAHRHAFTLANGAIPDGNMVCHTCDNPACCNAAHLFAGTAADNHNDMVQKGRRGRPCAVLTEQDVRSIRDVYASGAAFQRELAATYGVSQATISSIIRRETWRTVA